VYRLCLPLRPFETVDTAPLGIAATPRSDVYRLLGEARAPRRACEHLACPCRRVARARPAAGRLLLGCDRRDGLPPRILTGAATRSSSQTPCPTMLWESGACVARRARRSAPKCRTSARPGALLWPHESIASCRSDAGHAGLSRGPSISLELPRAFSATAGLAARRGSLLPIAVRPPPSLPGRGAGPRLTRGAG